MQKFTVALQQLTNGSMLIENFIGIPELILIFPRALNCAECPAITPPVKFELVVVAVAKFPKVLLDLLHTRQFSSSGFMSK
jgi:hypothetical protein